MTLVIAFDDSRHRFSMTLLSADICHHPVPLWRGPGSLPMGGILFSANVVAHNRKDAGLDESLAGSDYAAPVQRQVPGDPIPTERSPVAVPTEGMANDPEQNAPLRSVQRGIQKRVQ
jgi:hypothetical protein